MASGQNALPTTLDASKIHFGAPVRLNNGQNIIPLSTTPGQFSYATRVQLQLGKDQHSMLHSQYGLNKPQPMQNDPNRTSIEVTLSPEHQDMFRALDAAVVDYCSKNSQALFKTPTLTKSLHSTVCEKEGREPFLRAKVITGGDTKHTEVRLFNEDMTTCSVSRPDCLVRDSRLILILSTQGIWYNTAQFGVSFKAESILACVPRAVSGLGRFSLAPGVTEVAAGPKIASAIDGEDLPRGDAMEEEPASAFVSGLP